MMLHCLAAALLGATAVPAAAADETNCTFTAPSGDFYNLTGLIVAGGGDWTIGDSQGNNTYFWNSCAGATPRGEDTDPDLVCLPGSAACLTGPSLPAGAFYTLGKLDSSFISETRPGFLALSYDGGSFGDRLTVEIECDAERATPLFEVTTPPDPPRFFTLRVRSVHGCVLPPPTPPCGLSVPEGDYDLSALVGTTFSASSDETPFTYDYFLGVCAPVAECAEADSPDPAGSGSCQVIQNPDPTSPPDSYTFDNGNAGARNISLIPGLPSGGEGVRITYRDGGRCVPIPGQSRASVLDVYCTPGVPDTLKYVAEDPECVYTFALETERACLAPPTAGERRAKKRRGFDGPK